MKAYKINLTNYTMKTPKTERVTIKGDNGEIKSMNDVPVLDNNGDPVYRDKTIFTAYELARVLCNPNLKKDDKSEAPDLDFIEVGAIAAKIEGCTTGELIVSSEEKKVLEARIKVIGRYLNFDYYEMVRRVLEAVETKVQEVATAKGKEKIEQKGSK